MLNIRTHKLDLSDSYYYPMYTEYGYGMEPVNQSGQNLVWPKT